MSDPDRRLLIDTDTATDDAMALVLAGLSSRVAIEGVTIVAGNVPFDRQVENAKHTLDLVDADATVYEGAREPLLKDFEHAVEVHGDDGLGGLAPEIDAPSGEAHAVDYLVEVTREEPGEFTLVCLGPLTNLALACKRDPGLGDRLDEVWVMGGAANTLGNVTPAAEFNFWVDPDAAKLAVRELDVTLVDWGLSRRAALRPADVERILDAAGDSPYAAFFEAVLPRSRHDGRVVQPDPLAVALLLEPDLIDSAGTYHVDVDERDGLTRGYSLVDEEGTTGRPARTRVVEAVDAEGFRRVYVDAFVHGEPHRTSG